MGRVDTRNHAQYWMPPWVPGLSLLRADFTTHEYAPHAHEAFVVAVTEAGGAEIRSRGRVEQATARSLFVSNPAEPQSSCLGTNQYWRYRAFYLTRSTIDALARGLGLKEVPRFARNMLTDPDLIDDLAALHRALETDRDAPQGQERLLDVMGRLFQRHGSGGGRIAEPPRDAGPLHRSLAEIHSRHVEGVSLGELGHAVGLTPFQLIALFRRTTGLTPHTYLTRVRLNAACRMLTRGSSIAEAAVGSGFYDQSALTRHFKSCYGITPRQFVQAATGSDRSRA